MDDTSVYYTKERIEKLVEKVDSDGIALLNPMEFEKQKELYRIVKKLGNIAMFTITNDGKKQVVLKQRKMIESRIDFGEIFKEANKCYISGDYYRCIELLRELIQYGRPKTWTLGLTGLVLSKIGKEKVAIEYLTVANANSLANGEHYDFTNTINRIKNKCIEEDDYDSKVKCEVSEDEFLKDINRYYGINNIANISNFILNGSSFDEACLEYGISEEDKSLVALLLARECYIQEYYYIGDRYMKIYEKLKKKSALAKKLSQDIKKGRDFYKNRNTEGHELLTLVKKTNN